MVEDSGLICQQWLYDIQQTRKENMEKYNSISAN